MTGDLAEPKPVFEPAIIAFLCNWCSYAGADKAGLNQIPVSPNLRSIRVMCSGRVEPELVLEAYRQGADAVLILGCHFGDCHYKEGNYRATQRHRLLVELLRQHGIEEARCRFDYVAASEGEKFSQVVAELTETVRKLGRLRQQGREETGVIRQ
jgi:F420-non-reducing hydrogenase iron-sulfur subunit